MQRFWPTRGLFHLCIVIAIVTNRKYVCTFKKQNISKSIKTVVKINIYTFQDKCSYLQNFCDNPKNPEAIFSRPGHQKNLWAYETGSVAGPISKKLQIVITICCTETEYLYSFNELSIRQPQ